MTCDMRGLKHLWRLRWKPRKYALAKTYYCTRKGCGVVKVVFAS